MMNETLIDLFSDATGIAKSEVSPTLSRHDDDRWDSLNYLRLITSIEETFSMRLTMDEIESVATLSDLDRLVSERKS